MKVVAMIIVLLSIQFIPSLTQEAPTPSPEVLSPTPTPLGLGDCWDEINNCVTDHVNNSRSLPQYDPTSASFNITDYLCCSLIQEIATTQKPCFCTISTYLNQNPSMSRNIIPAFTVCGIVTSLPALDDFCLGEALSPVAAPMMSPSNS